LPYRSYNSSMLINFVGTFSRARTLTREQSKNLLQFCRAVGATLFTVNFVFAKYEASEKLMQEFYARLSQFSCGEKELKMLRATVLRDSLVRCSMSKASKRY